MSKRVEVTRGSSFATTSGAIVRQAIREPQTRLVVVPAKAAVSRPPEDTPGAVVASAHFLTTLRYVVIVTAILLVVWVSLALLLPEPTANQQKVFDTLTHLVTLGVGAVIGLLGGKQLT